MPEIAFYHHTRRGVDDTLPTLLEKSLARGWRVVVQATNEQRLQRLDAHLWSYRPESFLPHGTKADAASEKQPIYLTCDNDNPNGADIRFFVDGARIAPALAGASAPPSAPRCFSTAPMTRSLRTRARNGKSCGNWAIASSTTNSARAADGTRRRGSRNHER